MKTDKSKTNVLMICVDHWPGRLLGGEGHPHIHTPTLDQLCDNGVRFSNAYSCHPTCIPARRSLMTGTSARTHGDRIFNQTLRMPEHLPTMAETFRRAGYQTSAVGKLHVYPQRDRIGFEEALICEEGRHHLGMLKDDYEIFLADKGHAGAEMAHGMGVNQYSVRPWHLDGELHPTHWTTKNMCRAIQRRNPDKPGFWYCSYIAPHPPITPPRDYWDMYSDVEIDGPVIGDWALDPETLPYSLKNQMNRKRTPSEPDGDLRARRGFYAQCSYIDHQIRLLIGTLWEEGLLDNTLILFTCDHGDALGDHGLWGKREMLESSARIPMILVPPAGMSLEGKVRDNLVCLRDVMPTVLDLCGIEVPETVEGRNMLGPESCEYLYGEHNEDELATRMIRKDRFKLIYYAAGNRSLLFDLEVDPRELRNLADDPDHAPVLEELKALLVKELYGGDLEWLRDGELVGLPYREYKWVPDRNLSAQRGWRL